MDKSTQAKALIVALLVVLHIGLIIIGHGRIREMFQSLKGEIRRELPSYTWGKVAMYNLWSITIIVVVEVGTSILLSPLIPYQIVTYGICGFIGSALAAVFAAASIAKAKDYRSKQEGLHGRSTR